MNFDFIPYFKTLSEQHKLIRHSETDKRFYIISGVNQLEELLSNPKTRYPVVLVNDDDSGRLMDNQGDSVWDKRPYSFYVFDNFKNIMDIKERNQKKSICRSIGFDMISKMMLDKKNEMKGLVKGTGLRNLDISSITYFMVGPLLDNLIGMEFFFAIDEKPNLKFNPEQWLLTQI